MRRIRSDTFLYGYVPTAWVCLTFISFFGLSTIVHLGQALYWKRYWLIPTAVLAGIAEVIGWSGRYWSSQNPRVLTPYLIQISTTIIAPTPLVAANFIILGRLIQVLGAQYSRLGPKMYTVVFLGADIIALVVQAIGGARASNSVQQDKSPETGGNIMLAGICFQMAAIIFYVLLAGEFLWRVTSNRPLAQGAAAKEEPTASDEEKKEPNVVLKEYTASTPKIRWMLVGLSFSTICVLIRSIYRTIELTNGFAGPIIHTQQLFNFLDGMMILFAMLCLNILHPGYLLP